jgi:predicted alpha-1,2-mannosidase
MRHNLIYSSFIASAILFSCNSHVKTPYEYVDPFIGTGFHGHTYPGATVPFGAVQLSPDTRADNWDACSGYHHDDSTIKGFSHTHLSGTGCCDLGDILFRPTSTRPNLNADTLYRAATFSHDSEKASPGYYSVVLDSEDIKAELTATTHVGVHRYTYQSADAEACVIIDLDHVLSSDDAVTESAIAKISDTEIGGMRCTRGWVDNQYVYFVARFSRAFTSIDTIGNKAIVSFGKADNTPLTVNVALSTVSQDNAMLNLDQEAPKCDFDSTLADARKLWEDALSTITVEGGSDEDLTNFYTSLYHTMVVPNTVSDVNGEYRRHDMTVDSVAAGHAAYSTFSIWDTFRAWHPLMTLIDADLVNDMVNSMLNMYDTTGELPIWPLSAGETGCMIGYHSVSVITDAYMKGIRGFDANKALDAMVASSEKNSKGASYYIANGYIPSDSKSESVSCTLEYAYDDWCIAQLAKQLGRDDVYNTYIARCQNYVNVFDGQTGFFRGRKADGNWNSNFNSFTVDRAYTEATAWQYRYFAPHDVNGLIQLFGGKDNFIKALDDLFAADSKVDGELSDITGLIGQYAHGNEPSHHIAYLYNYVGQPWKTQELTRRLLKEMYAPTPEGIIGNEDCGQMSAWYVLSALGLYSVCPGSNEFALTTPLFEKATIKLANGKELTITANNPQRNVYIKEVKLNGNTIDANFITYDQLMQGGELAFTLTYKPDTDGANVNKQVPYSLTSANTVSIPYISEDLNLFIDQTSVTMGCLTDGATIHYTLDGSEPTEQSAVYTQPLTISANATIKAKGFKQGYEPSATTNVEATRADLAPALNITPTQNGVAYNYYEGICEHVADIEKGKLIESGTLPEPAISSAKTEDHFAFIFSGYIFAESDGVYTFQTVTDDGSKLYIDGKQVVDNDGGHAAIPATGRIALAKGFHAFRLLYFEDYEGQEFGWSWQTPGDKELKAIPAKNLYIK